MLTRLAKFITDKPKTVIIIGLLLLIPSIFRYANTRINYDILSYLPDNLDSVKGEAILDKSFHTASSSFLIVENMPADDIQTLQEKIKKVDGVSNVIGANDILGVGIPASFLPDILKNLFYGNDTNSTLIMIQHEESAASERTMNSVAEIRSIMNRQCFISGMSVIMTDMKDMVESQTPVFMTIAIALALIVMCISMESFLLPFVLLISLFIAVIYNMGSNFFMGEISFLTQCIASILQLAVTMDYSVFLIDRYREEKRNYSNNKDAMVKAITSTFTSLAGSSLTTIFGFLALCFMKLRLGFDIGFVMAKGVVIGVITVVLLLPALILVLDKYLDKFTHKSLIPNFNRPVNLIIKHRKFLAIIFAILIIPAYIAQKNVDIYYSMDKMMPADLPSIIGLNKMKTDFNMATTHFVIVDDTLPSATLNKMVDDIKKVDGISNALAYNGIVGPAIPDTIIPDEIKAICKKDGKQMMMINSVYSSSTDEVNNQINKLTDIVKSYDKTGYITGEGALYKDMIEVSNRDFIVTNIISIAAIFILIAILFKSISIPVLLVASIEFAIFINIGISYLTGSTIAFIAPTIISCVQLGATVDYAILLTTRYKEELNNGCDKKNAMQIAASSAYRSIWLSALVFFVATMGIYIISDIEIIKSICQMLARGSVISAAVIMLMLNPILVNSEKIISKTTLKWNKGN